MSPTTYDVLLNSCAGKFAFPIEVVSKVFTLFPPTSVIGSRLFPRCKSNDFHIITPAETPSETWTTYYVIHSVEPLTGEYQLVSTDARVGSGYHKFATVDMTTYYSLSEFNVYDWRTNTEIIRLAHEYDILETTIGDSLLRVERVPIHCGFHIINRNGNEEIVIDFPV